jgi:hypothetical protein
MALEELTVKLANRPGQLARVARVLAREKINLAAISVAAAGRSGLARLVVDRPDPAIRALESEGFDVERHGLITVRLADRAGSFLKVLALLADAKVSVQGVAILVVREGNDCLVALSCSNLAKGREVLAKARVVSDSAERLVGNGDLVAFAPSIPTESVGFLL